MTASNKVHHNLYKSNVKAEQNHLPLHAALLFLTLHPTKAVSLKLNRFPPFFLSVAQGDFRLYIAFSG